MKSNLLPASLIIGFLLLVTACNQQQSATDAAPSPDSLIQQWNNAWNQHDSAALARMFNEKSLVIFNSKRHFPGRDSIMNGWIRTTLPQVANLKTVKISSAASAEMVYYTGDYTLDIVQKDSLLGQDIGLFTTIWKKDSEQQWKIDLMMFGVVPKQ